MQLSVTHSKVLRVTYLPHAEINLLKKILDPDELGDVNFRGINTMSHSCMNIKCASLHI